MLSVLEVSRGSTLNTEPVSREIALIQAAATRANLLRQKTAYFSCKEYQIIKRGEYALKQLWSDHQPLIRRLVATYQAKEDSFRNSDLKQEATLAFFNAVATFDPNKGSKLSTWAYIQIRSRLQEITLQTFRNTVAEVRAKHSNSVKCEPEPNLEQGSPEQIFSLLKALTEKQRQVVILALKNLEWAEIALKLQSTQAAVRMLWNRAVKRLRLLLVEERQSQRQPEEPLDIKEYQPTQETKDVIRQICWWVKPHRQGQPRWRVLKQLPKRSADRGTSFEREKKNLVPLNGLNPLNLFMERRQRIVLRLLATRDKTLILNPLLSSLWTPSPLAPHLSRFLTKKISSLHSSNSVFLETFREIASQKSQLWRSLRDNLYPSRFFHYQIQMKRSFCLNPSYSKGVRGSPRYFCHNLNLCY